MLDGSQTWSCRSAKCCIDVNYDDGLKFNWKFKIYQFFQIYQI